MDRSVVIARAQGTGVLNPILYSDLATGEVLNRIFDHLVLTDRAGQHVPGRLLRGWTRSPDGLTWDFELLPEARWHDGRQVTAHDAVFTFESILDPEVASARRPEFLVRGEPIRFFAVDPGHLRAVLPAPYAPFLSALAWRPIIPRHVYADGPLRDHPANAAPVGSGAFRFAGRSDSELVLRAHTGYHLGRPPLDEVVWRVVSDQDSALEQVLTGQADFVPGLSPRLAARAEAAAEVRLVRSLDAGFTYLGFNTGHPKFADRRVRRALCHAVDRAALVARVLGGEGQVAHGPFAPGGSWYRDDLPRFEHDPRLARHLLREAGIGDLAFTISTVEGDEVKRQTAELIATQCAEIGVDVRIEALPMADLLHTRVRTREFEALVMALVPHPDPAFLHAFYHSSMLTPVGWNRLAYRDRRVDRLLDAGQTELDVAARKELVGEALRTIVADAPQLFLFHPVVVDAVRDTVVMPELPETAANRFMYLHQWRLAGSRADRHQLR
ncbi:ABC transporter substrate-binding protein [Lentzea kentuckyensis]|uniref:ABC transporter substrate-binding protein n=1 Tax=Lentzea kentuckyensis TaxID=360086 RepID=UPI001179FE25|nr:ABC transporter substrate-binding protein [Lentzea kentuckyensis]